MGYVFKDRSLLQVNHELQKNVVFVWMYGVRIWFSYLFHCLTVYLSTARPDTPFLSSQFRHEPRPREKLSVELWSEAAEIRRQENKASAHAQERYI